MINHASPPFHWQRSPLNAACQPRTVIVISIHGSTWLIMTLILFSLLSLHATASDSDTTVDAHCPQPTCNIERIMLPMEEFTLPDSPVIFSTSSTRNKQLAGRMIRSALLAEYGEEIVTLASSNTFSYERVEMKLSEYVAGMNNPSKLANETYYMFGDNYEGIWKELSDLYAIPPCKNCKKAAAVAIGIGGLYSGVPFHMHGPGFSEVLHGSKRWFLASPEVEERLHYDPNMTQFQWIQNVYPALLAEQNKTLPTDSVSDSKPPLIVLDCVISPGEILYFPDRWMHATLNIEEYNAFDGMNPSPGKYMTYRRKPVALTLT